MLLAYILFVGQVLGNILPRNDVILDTKIGQISGLTSEDGAYSMFLGIPYAIVDEEDPFSPAVPHEGFEEVYNADDDSVYCPQMNWDGEAIGQVQCLQLNVFVPSTAGANLPVMVYIHGGAFVEGSGTNIMGRPTFLLDKGVIVVTINYRVGIYGFMCTDSPKAPGNIGLKDQLIALRWVKNNIDDFGGNPDQITIYGESAGGMSVHFHLISPHELLYNRAIIQSGAAGSPFTVVPVNNDVAIRIAELLGFVTQDVEQALDFIARTDVHEAILAGSTIKSTTQYSMEPLTKVCVEREFDGIERFVTDNPNVAVNDKLNAVDIMIGYASQELIFLHVSQEDAFYDNYSFKGLLEFGFDVTNLDEMADTVQKFYIGDDTQGKDLENDITSFASDFVFNHPTERAIRSFMKSGAAVIYHYMFSYVGERSSVEINNSTLIGASHADDLNYLYDATTLVNPEIKTAEDQLTIDRMTTLWTNFAKYGNPTPEITDLLPVKWEPVTEQTEYYLDIDKELSLQTRPYHDRLAFWDVFYELNDRYARWNVDN